MSVIKTEGDTNVSYLELQFEDDIENQIEIKVEEGIDLDPSKEGKHQQAPYKCEICRKSFQQMGFLKRHLLHHQNKTTKEFQNQNKTNLIKHRDTKLHPCEKCSKVFKSDYKLKKHLELHVSNNSLQCKICYKQFTGTKWLEKHTQLEHHVEKIKCEHCPQLITPANLQKHLLKHTYSFKCTICLKVYRHKKHLNRHMEVHNGKVYKCEICAECFRSNSSMLRHTAQVHNSKSNYRCTSCLKYFHYLGDLKRHENTSVKCSKKLNRKRLDTSRKTRTGDDSEKTRTEKISHKVSTDKDAKTMVDGNEKSIYGKINYSTEFEKSSIKTNSKGRDFPDTDEEDILEYDYSEIFSDGDDKDDKEDNLTKETSSPAITQSIVSKKKASVATKENIFQCKLCRKKLKSEKSLKRHTRKVHCPEKTLKCEICSKVFWNQSHFDQHSLVHSDVRPYSCTVCGLMFTRKTHLDRHSLKHSGKQPRVPCNKCAKTFYPKENLSRHLIEVHGEASEFQCHLCSKMFLYDYDLKKHLKNCARIRNIKNKVANEECSNSTESCQQTILHQENSEEGLPMDIPDVSNGELTGQSLMYSEVREHSVDKNDKSLYQSELCAQVISKDNIGKHATKHTKQKNVKDGNNNGDADLYQCSLCSQVVQKVNFEEHCLTHADEKINSKNENEKVSFECEICGSVVSIDDLEKHSLSHTDEELSSKKENNKNLNKYSLQIVNDIGIEMHTLTHSDQEIHLQKEANENIMDSKEYQHQCSVCSKVFLTDGDLNTHSATHTGENQSAKCVICGKQFGGGKSVLGQSTIDIDGDVKKQQNIICFEHFVYLNDSKSHLLVPTLGLTKIN